MTLIYRVIPGANKKVFQLEIKYHEKFYKNN